MSSTAVKVNGTATSARQSPRLPLSVVPARPVVRQGWFLLAMLATLVLSLLATLMINTALAQGSYERGRLVNESTQLADRQESLTIDLNALRAPAGLAQRALSLGMVPAESAAFINLAKGRVLGVAEPATGEKPFMVITEPTLAPSKTKAKTPTQATSSSPATTTDAPAKD